jgi:hypothetical protein
MSLLLLVKHFSWLVRVRDHRAHEARVRDGERYSGAHRVGLRLAVVRCHRLCNKSQSSQIRLGHSRSAIHARPFTLGHSRSGHSRSAIRSVMA